MTADIPWAVTLDAIDTRLNPLFNMPSTYTDKPDARHDDTEPAGAVGDMSNCTGSPDMSMMPRIGTDADSCSAGNGSTRLGSVTKGVKRDTGTAEGAAASNGMHTCKRMVPSEGDRGGVSEALKLRKSVAGLADADSVTVAAIVNPVRAGENQTEMTRNSQQKNQRIRSLHVEIAH